MRVVLWFVAWELVFVLGMIVAAGAPKTAPAIGTPVQVGIPAPCTSSAGDCRIFRAALVAQPAGGESVDVVYWLPGSGTGIPLAGLQPCPTALPTAPCYQGVP